MVVPQKLQPPFVGGPTTEALTVEQFGFRSIQTPMDPCSVSYLPGSSCQGCDQSVPVSWPQNGKKRGSFLLGYNLGQLSWLTSKRC